MRIGEHRYGESVGECIVECLRDRQAAGAFEWAHERPGFDTGGGREFASL